MKAPDKIYVAKTTFPEYVDWEGSPINTKEVSDNDICYIRKNALLEWLNAKVNDCGHTTPFRIAIQSVIDKLNSM